MARANLHHILVNANISPRSIVRPPSLFSRTVPARYGHCRRGSREYVSSRNNMLEYHKLQGWVASDEDEVELKSKEMKGEVS
jgi:hypothetical protein